MGIGIKIVEAVPRYGAITLSVAEEFATDEAELKRACDEARDVAARFDMVIVAPYEERVIPGALLLTFPLVQRGVPA